MLKFKHKHTQRLKLEATAMLLNSPQEFKNNCIQLHLSINHKVLGPLQRAPVQC